MNVQARRRLRRFFKGYRAVTGNHGAEGVQGFKSFFRRLAKDIPALQERRRRHERAQELKFAPHYNIFRVLPIERRETVLHSPMLAHLLDPTASHGQGCLFLRAFFEVAHANARLSAPSGPLEPGEWSVRSEVYIGNGSIDLLIDCLEQKYILVIENKIDALEQETQLSRYYRWMEENRADYSTRQLVFLTPTGRESDAGPTARYFPMSYHKDILELLRRTIPKIQPPQVKELVAQYQAVLTDWGKETNDESTPY